MDCELDDHSGYVPLPADLVYRLLRCGSGDVKRGAGALGARHVSQRGHVAITSYLEPGHTAE